MMTDFVLASLHHVLIFLLMAALAAELVMVRPGIAGATVARIARIDGMYGAISVAVLAVGVCRVVWGAKGWEAYSGNVWFWHKMGAFVLVGLLSIAPTLRFLSWRRQAAAAPSYVVPDAEVRAARRFMHAEAGIFLLIPIFAAAMARYGY
jgi:putative membrane protein